jgi:hypothetical protein
MLIFINALGEADFHRPWFEWCQQSWHGMLCPRILWGPPLSIVDSCSGKYANEILNGSTRSHRQSQLKNPLLNPQFPMNPDTRAVN